VTGASRGIGRDIALELARTGIDLILTHYPAEEDARDMSAAVETAGALGVNAQALPLDLSSEVSFAAFSTELVRHAPAKILINNAGVMQTRRGLSTTAADFARCFDVNVVGLWRAASLFVDLLDQGPGRIINIGSGAGRAGSAEKPAYDASKAAVISLTQSLARALAPRDITVNCVCPGIVRTAMCEQFAVLVAEEKAADSFEDFARDAIASIPLGRLQTGSEVGRLVAFLASAESSNITGQTINVDGGIMMY
jgi:3-oxoacyl-[acyl-carrier protein] reductase